MLIQEMGSEMSAGTILFYAYMAGILLVLVWQLIGRGYAYSLKYRSRPAVDPCLKSLAEDLKKKLGINRNVSLYLSEVASVPFSMGVFRPSVVLPNVTHNWPKPVIETVLLHELAHIKRKDVVFRLIAQLFCCLHWINPLAWYGFGRLLMEQEIACDDFVLKSGTKPSVYARNLLALAKVRAGRLDFATTAFGRRAELKDRLFEILKPRRSKSPSNGPRILLFAFMFLLLLVPISAINLWEYQGPPEKTVKQAIKPLPPPPPPAKNETKSSELDSSLPPPPPPPELSKESVNKAIQQMKANGASQVEIEEFLKKAKAKLSQMENEKKKMEEAAKVEKAKQDKELQKKPSTPEKSIKKEKGVGFTAKKPIPQLA
jgi:beta-lactamase regulating signal transducer with metallopeptidase domain